MTAKFFPTVAGCALGLLIIGLVALLVFNHVSGETQARFWVDHTHEVIEQNLSLAALATTAEDAERGYLLSADRSQLARLDAVKSEIARRERQLAATVADNQGEIQRVKALDALVGARMALIEKCVDQARGGDFAGARLRARGGRGPALMRAIAAQSTTVSGVERALLAQRIGAAGTSETRSFSIALAVALAALAALAALLAAVSQLSRTNRQLTEAVAAAETAREAERASKALIDAFFAHSPDYLYCLELAKDGRFVIGEINPAFTRVLGISSKAVKGKPIDELMSFQNAKALTSHFERVRNSDRPVTTRDVIPGFPDGPRTWESILAPVRDAGGAPVRLIGSVRDITDRVKTEARLREAQRMEAIGQLTGGIAHDFNNLLQVIRGNLDLLDRPQVDKARTARAVRNAILGTERAAQLVRQLLAFARRQPLAPEVIDLSSLMGETADLLRRTLGETIDVEVKVAADLWYTLADPAQVESALINLALNARDAMPQGGKLTIEVSNVTVSAAEAREDAEAAPGDYVLIAAADEGEGMDAEVKARAIEPFFTTKPDGRGSGLGLSMIWGFARQSGGHLRIDSEKGRGATIRLYLPRSRLEPATPQSSPAKADQYWADRQVLVVEDEDAVRAAAIAMLNDLGLSCLEAADAAAALAVLEAEPGIDLVLSDVIMPGPVSSREFIERAAALRPDLPILFTSGYPREAVVREGRLDEGVSLLAKPYGRDELAAKLAQLAPAAAPKASPGKAEKPVATRVRSRS
ncbi:MAG: CHASE3 domain-containing protein [Caulobacteraceae bacterium]